VNLHLFFVSNHPFNTKYQEIRRRIIATLARRQTITRILGITWLVQDARQALGSNTQETLWETLTTIDDTKDQFERRTQFIETFALWWRFSMAHNGNEVAIVDGNIS
jgi:hypothetical protein